MDSDESGREKSCNYETRVLEILEINSVVFVGEMCRIFLFTPFSKSCTLSHSIHSNAFIIAFISFFLKFVRSFSKQPCLFQAAFGA